MSPNEPSITAEPRVEARKAQHYVAIPIKVSLQNWDNAIPLVYEVMRWLEQHNIERAGVPFFRYWVVGDLSKDFVMEVGVPVPQAVQGDDRVKAGSIPAGTYATLLHHGNPYGINETHQKLKAWGEAQGLHIKSEHRDEQEVFSGVFDFYQTNPAEEPNPSRWTTEVAHLLVEKAPKAK